MEEETKEVRLKRERMRRIEKRLEREKEKSGGRVIEKKEKKVGNRREREKKRGKWVGEGRGKRKEGER